MLREYYDRGESYDVIDILINGDDRPKTRKHYKHGKFHMTYSPTLDEQPVNLVVYRDILESLPNTKHFIVTKDYIKNAIIVK